MMFNPERNNVLCLNLIKDTQGPSKDAKGIRMMILEENGLH